MPKSPGQSAMEYMLTYGWAILVVMVVGIVMWQIGIFNIGGSIPTTSDGFAQLKPMLATCKFTDESFVGDNWHGFQCMFTNPTGASIIPTDINVTIDGKYCQGQWITDLPQGGVATGHLRLCNSVSVCTSGLNDCFGGNCPLTIPAEGTFFVTHDSTSTWSVSYPDEPCWDIEPGNRYGAFIDITYNISMLGETVTKHSTGHIRGMME